MKQLFFSIFVAFAVIGCSSAPIQTFRPSGNEELWQIDGSYKPGLVDSEISIRINGMVVAVGKLSDFQNTVEFSGDYKTHKINASCSRVSDWSGSKIQCIVFVDNERAATLQF